MNHEERYREYTKEIENHRNRLIDLFYKSADKSMDLWVDRILKDCELYITLFGLSLAWLSFLYDTVVLNNCSEIIFIGTIVIIIGGIIWSFVVKQTLSMNLEKYHRDYAIILQNEINELDYDDVPKEAHELLKKRLTEQKRLLQTRWEKHKEIENTYKQHESKSVIQKHIIFGLYILSSALFILLLII